MRQSVHFIAILAGALALSACDKNKDQDVKKALESINVIDESNLNDVMLTSADPEEAVAYFQRAVREKPDRVDLKRGLAKSLVRANRAVEATKVLNDIIQGGSGTSEDRVLLADALIRSNEWKRAETELNAVPPTYETFDRYRLEAMIADANKRWDKADSYYDTAAGMTTRPAGVLNNWGYSKLTRGDYPGAEKLFGQALTHDRNMFVAKNNLVLARAAQRKYDLPIIPMTQVERAQLLYTIALSAIKQGDVVIGRGLLEEAIETHPQHFEEAVRALEALNH
ncbi:tetratricopeptide repeat protein [Albidovulum sediminicola]|uniref:Tetratricopeptide repeat protein n=1 Tax=Albidovulum sediminicola TaxID=2984331 RepID=A0ABT2Z341_9RHOB|nr:tetratricopeptide repeat protein [Defluviimonas sp. WL0075]MCV2865568.1 tetratricopeptide repeat protein [Defluviimonas sp. WL0075]